MQIRGRKGAPINIGFDMESSGRKRRIRRGKGNYILLRLVPQIHEELDRRWPVPRVMIICKGEDFSHALILDKSPEYDDPTL